MEVTIVSFADKYFYKSQQELIKSAKYYGFNNFFCYSDIWLRKQKDFYSANKSILNQKRGAGYWLWKPYIILDALNRIDENDILIYIDSGAKFVNPISEISKLLKEKDLLLFYNNGHKNYEWTKRDCFVYMDCDAGKFHLGHQVIAGYIFCRKTKFVINLMEEWFSYCMDERIITDNANTCGLGNLIGFKEHRHDQSILSNLAVKYNIELFRDPSQWGNKYKIIKYRQEGEFLENNLYWDSYFSNSPYPTILDGHRTKYKSDMIDIIKYYFKIFRSNYFGI